jgi:hypothetical protein
MLAGFARLRPSAWLCTLNSIQRKRRGPGACAVPSRLAKHARRDWRLRRAARGRPDNDVDVLFCCIPREYANARDAGLTGLAARQVRATAIAVQPTAAR